MLQKINGIKQLEEGKVFAVIEYWYYLVDFMFLQFAVLVDFRIK